QGAIGDALRMDPTHPVYSPNKYGNYWEWLDASGAPIQQAVKNPLGVLELYNSTSTVKRSIGNIQLGYDIPSIAGLTAHLNAGYDISSSQGSVSIPADAAMDYAQGGFTTQYSQYKRNKVLDFYLNYVKKFPNLHSKIDLTGGYSYQDFFRGSPAYPNKNVAGTILSIPIADSSQNTLVSFYGRLNYSYKDKYLLTATLRQDGSSRFSPANRWGLFPSAAFAWRIKEESFLKNSKVVSDLKLRLGYGTTGNQDIGNDYPYLPIYTLSSNVAQYPFGNNSYYTYRAEAYDPNIKWEQTTTYNAGLDYGFFDGRISGSVDAYYKQTTNLLADIPTAAGSNLSNHVLTNVGSIENKGVEFSVNAIPVTNSDLTWNIGFNITYNENKITKLSKLANDTTAGILTGNIGGGTGNSIQILSVGYPAYTFYVYKQVYDQSGKPIEGVYADVNNNPSNLFYRYQSPNPTVTLGLNSQVSYKKWDFSFVMRANIGNYMYNNVRSGGGTLNGILNTQGYLGNGNIDFLKTRFSNSQYYSDYYMENASFLRMDDISLGYNFGQIINHTANLRVSANVQNVFVVTNYTGLDPEIYGGIDNNIYPRPRIFSLGLNLGF
ncbi:MAG: SusC/RagA family TonB-linked outer membrane protein, partial [Chitinophagaceae bacterium]